MQYSQRKTEVGYEDSREEIEMKTKNNWVKPTILELREMGCNKLADLLTEDIEA